VDFLDNTDQKVLHQMLDLVENWFEYGNANDDGYAVDVYRRLRNEEMRMPKFTGLNIFNNQNMVCNYLTASYRLFVWSWINVVD